MYMYMYMCTPRKFILTPSKSQLLHVFTLPFPPMHFRTSSLPFKSLSLLHLLPPPHPFALLLSPSLLPLITLNPPPSLPPSLHLSLSPPLTCHQPRPQSLLPPIRTHWKSCSPAQSCWSRSLPHSVAPSLPPSTQHLQLVVVVAAAAVCLICRVYACKLRGI